MGRSCGTYGGQDMCVLSSDRETWGKESIWKKIGLHVDLRIILKWILKKQDAIAWTALIGFTPSGAEFKNYWSRISIPLFLDGVERGNFFFTALLDINYSNYWENPKCVMCGFMSFGALSASE